MDYPLIVKNSQMIQ